jgi:hypothetical protein
MEIPSTTTIQIQSSNQSQNSHSQQVCLESMQLNDVDVRTNKRRLFPHLINVFRSSVFALLMICVRIYFSYDPKLYFGFLRFFAVKFSWKKIFTPIFPPFQYQTVLQTNGDGTFSLIQVDSSTLTNNPSIITLPDGTTAQVQGVATVSELLEDKRRQKTS